MKLGTCVKFDTIGSVAEIADILSVPRPSERERAHSKLLPALIITETIVNHIGHAIFSFLHLADISCCCSTATTLHFTLFPNGRHLICPFDVARFSCIHSQLTAQLTATPVARTIYSLIKIYATKPHRLLGDIERVP